MIYRKIKLWKIQKIVKDLEDLMRFHVSLKSQKKKRKKVMQTFLKQQWLKISKNH